MVENFTRDKYFDGVGWPSELMFCMTTPGAYLLHPFSLQNIPCSQGWKVTMDAWRPS